MNLRYQFIIGSSFGVLLGSFLVIGTALKWKLLIDPPNEWSPFNCFATLKKQFGVKFLIGFNYIVGTIMVLIGIIFIFIGLSGVPIKYDR